MDSAYEELENCSVCFNGFDDTIHRPMLLPCMHTICIFCLRALKVTHITPPPSKDNDSRKWHSEGVCPFCRRTFNPLLVMENRYILVHLRQVEHLRASPKKSSSSASANSSASVSASASASAPPRDVIYDDAEGEEDQAMWCTECQSSTTPYCKQHFKLSFTQYINSMKESVGTDLSDLEIRFCTLSSSLQEMEKIADEISTALRVTTNELKGIRQNSEDLQHQVKDLKKSCDALQVPTEDNLMQPFAQLYKKMGQSGEWLLKYMSRMEKRISVQNLHQGTFKMNLDDRTISVTSRPSLLNSFDVSMKME